jgi:hypothetical protein
VEIRLCELGADELGVLDAVFAGLSRASRLDRFPAGTGVDRPAEDVLDLGRGRPGQRARRDRRAQRHETGNAREHLEVEDARTVLDVRRRQIPRRRPGLSGVRTRPWRLISGLGCGLVVVDHAAEDWSTSDHAVDRLGDRCLRAWRTQLQRAMRPLPVVVPRVLGEDAAQVSLAEDQHLIGDLGADG